MDNYKSSLIRKLKVKAKDVSDELKETKLIYNDAVRAFCVSMDSYCSSKGIKNPLDLIEKDEEEDKEELENDFKKLFRKISVLTHPDKTKDESSREILEDAVEAKKFKDIGSLTSIAHDLKIDLSNLDFNSIDALESSIEKSETEINNIHKSYPWSWYYAPMNKKDPILVSFIDNYV